MTQGLNPEDMLDQGFNAEHPGQPLHSLLENDLIRAVFEYQPPFGDQIAP